MKTVMLVFGTRPEAIKMCPLVKEFQKYPEDFKTVVCVTGQHREMLDQVLTSFDVKPDYDLNIMKQGQDLYDVTARVLTGMRDVFKECKPDVVLVHGDTTTSTAAALAAFYQQIPVGHVEAGLRTHNIYSPWPEEMNRKLITALTTYFFAPTEGNRRALERESVVDNVYVTGNTVIDAFQYTTRDDYRFANEDFAKHDFSKPTVLMTAHRRENLGEPLESICDAVLELCERHPDLRVVYPVHLNPAVRDTVFSKLGDHPQITLTDPVDVQDMHNAMARCIIVLTDSGGLQEEAPHLGKPVIVLRTETERPEAVEAGTAVVAGVERDAIVQITDEILTDQVVYDRMANAINPYGDGHASERIVAALKEQFI